MQMTLWLLYPHASVASESHAQNQHVEINNITAESPAAHHERNLAEHHLTLFKVPKRKHAESAMRRLSHFNHAQQWRRVLRFLVIRVLSQFSCRLILYLLLPLPLLSMHHPSFLCREAFLGVPHCNQPSGTHPTNEPWG